MPTSSAPQIGRPYALGLRYGDDSGVAELAYPLGGEQRGGVGCPPWGDYLARRARYLYNRAHHDGTIYRAHVWSDPLKERADIFEWARPIYSPAYLICEFWPGHVLAGAPDPDAGDGKGRPSALPIVAPGDADEALVAALRGAIAEIWKWSNWPIEKDSWVRRGAIDGDAILLGVDDELRRRVYMRVVDAANVVELVKDPWGNVRGYRMEEWRPDPRPDAPRGARDVRYVEEATRSGRGVHFQTFLDDGLSEEPWDWREDPPALRPEWTEDYGFIPCVHVQHRNMGLGWGWGELQPSLSKLLEVDDQASRLGDASRGEMERTWYFAGVAAGDVQIEAPESSAADPYRRRRARQALFGPAGSQPHDMSPRVDIAGVLENIRGIRDMLEREHPELLADDVGVAASGEARRVAREKVEALVVERRAAYDDSLVRMHQMLVSIAAGKGYPGFEMFDEGSYARGELDHAIGPRPVFSVSPAERIAEALQRATALKTYVDAGFPRAFAMRSTGYSDEEIAAVEAEAEAEHAANLARQEAALGVQSRRQRLALSGADGADEAAVPEGQ